MKKEELIKAIETIIHKYKNDHSSWYVAKKIYNLIKSSPQHETSKVITNEQAKEVCDCVYKDNCSGTSDSTCMTPSCADYVKQTG